MSPRLPLRLSYFPTRGLPVRHGWTMRLGRCVAIALVVGLSVGGCLSKGPRTTGSIATSEGANPNRSQVEALGRRYEANPGDKAAALAYGRALRDADQKAQANAVLEALAVKMPKDTEVLGAYGRSLIDVGRFQQAEDVLSRAHTPDRPDWRILSAQGTAADQQGAHDRAQRYYKTALKAAPDEPSVLSNLGLSYALTKRLPEAETVLRTAARHPNADERVRQNLALVLGLQGKFKEAEVLVKQDLPAEQANANVSYLKKVMSQPNSWAAMKALDKPPAAAPAGAGKVAQSTN